MTDPTPDLPPVPVLPMSLGAKIIGVLGGLIAVLYAVVVITGFEPMAPEREEIPASVRAGPGGYRTFHFWHSGYSGGK